MMRLFQGNNTDVNIQVQEDKEGGCFSPNGINWVYFKKSKNKYIELTIDNEIPEYAFEADGTLFCKLKDKRWFGFGRNAYGILGAGHRNEIEIPIEILIDGKSPIDIVSKDNTIFLQHPDKGWFAAGMNRIGQLGLEKREDIYTYTRIVIEKQSPIKIASDKGVSFFQLSDKRWFASCEIGQHVRSSHGKPKQIRIKNRIPNDIFIKSDALLYELDGEVYVAGSNKANRFGIDSIEFIETPLPLKIEGIFPKKVIVSDLTTFVQHIDGRWFGCGFNFNGQLGLGNKDNYSEFKEILVDGVPPSHIIPEMAGTFMRHPDGRLFCCGDNREGFLGLDFNIKEVVTPQELKIENETPIKITTNYQQAFFYMQNGDVYVTDDIARYPTKLILPHFQQQKGYSNMRTSG